MQKILSVNRKSHYPIETLLKVAWDQNCSFLILHMWLSPPQRLPICGALRRISSRNTRHSTTYANSKTYNFDPMQLCHFSVENTFIVAFKTP